MRSFKLDVIQIIPGHQMSDAFARVHFRVDDMACADALQDTRMLLGYGFRPQIGDPCIQQIAGGDDGSLDAVADGDNRGAECTRINLFDRKHICHICLDRRNGRRPTVDQHGILVHRQHVLTELVKCGSHRTAESAEPNHQNASIIVCHQSIPFRHIRRIRHFLMRRHIRRFHSPAVACHSCATQPDSIPARVFSPR